MTHSLKILKSFYIPSKSENATLQYLIIVKKYWMKSNSNLLKLDNVSRHPAIVETPSICL